ncbi:hypothetical protein HanPI659440_Chr15g0596161 [Helianthus annuus]|nr:hypothetical protein HanPI659440_Chr15g0596161 [Helianthus annuus]
MEFKKRARIHLGTGIRNETQISSSIPVNLEDEIFPKVICCNSGKMQGKHFKLKIVARYKIKKCVLLLKTCYCKLPGILTRIVK